MQKIRKAVIPAAGFGTRFLPETKAMPKEMLPIVDKPTIQYIVEEIKASGIERARRAYMKQSAREIILKMHYFYEAEEELEAEWKEFQRWRRRKKKHSTSLK